MHAAVLETIGILRPGVTKERGQTVRIAIWWSKRKRRRLIPN